MSATVMASMTGFRMEMTLDSLKGLSLAQVLDCCLAFALDTELDDLSETTSEDVKAVGLETLSA